MLACFESHSQCHLLVCSGNGSKTDFSVGANTVAALLIVVLRDWTDCWVATYFRTEVRPVSSVSVFGELKEITQQFHSADKFL